MATTNLYFVSSTSGNVSTPANATGAPDGTFTTDVNTNTPWTHEWALDTVAGGASGTQTFTLRVRKGSNTGDPTVDSVILKQSGTAVTGNLLGAPVSVTATTTQDIQVTTSGTFSDFNNLSLEIITSGVGGSPSTRNAVAIDAVTFLASYLTIITGTLAATESGDDTFAATGTVYWPPITGTFAVTEDADSLTSSGTVLVQGTLAATEAEDTFAASGFTITKGTGSSLSNSVATGLIQFLFKSTGTSSNNASVVATSYIVGSGSVTGNSVNTSSAQAVFDFGGDYQAGDIVVQQSVTDWSTNASTFAEAINDGEVPDDNDSIWSTDFTAPKEASFWVKLIPGSSTFTVSIRARSSKSTGSIKIVLQNNVTFVAETPSDTLTTTLTTFTHDIEVPSDVNVLKIVVS